MIQDILPHRLDNHYDPGQKPDAESIVLCYRGGEVLLREELFPKVRDFSSLDEEDLVYLFSVDGEKRYFLLRETKEIPEGTAFVPVRELRSKRMTHKYRAFVAYTGLQLANWYRNNRFCGRCGEPTFLDGKERAIRCSCGHVIYPRVVPAVIVGVLHEDRMLVTKYRTGYGHFALVAGFTEIGETLEETVAREVMEETGLTVRRVTYYKSQPWGIVDDLLAGFYCEAVGDAKVRLDEDELKIAEWRLPEEIELQPDDYSLTNEMMRRFKERAFGLEDLRPADPR